MKIAIAQMKIIPGNLKMNFETMRDLVLQATDKGARLIVFPEMSLPGYFLGDLWERFSFLKDCEYYHSLLRELSEKIDLIFGSVGIDYSSRNEDGRVRKYNAVYHASQGSFRLNTKTHLPFWIKALMPNYGPFDDSRHFYDLRKLAIEKGCQPGDLYEPLRIRDDESNLALRVGVIVCEDGWDTHYSFSPAGLFSSLCQHDLFFNLSCSPFSHGKPLLRQKNFSALAKQLQIPIFYVNSIGVQNTGKTIHGFDGSSAFYDVAGESTYLGGFFQETCRIFNFQEGKVRPVGTTLPLRLPPSVKTEETLIALEYITGECLSAWKISQMVIGVSGGIDSALAATLFSRLLPREQLKLVNMPSQFNSSLTKDAAAKLAQYLGCDYRVLEIETSSLLTRQQLQQTGWWTVAPGESGIVSENIQARDRGARLLASLAAAIGGVFPCNVNKIEIAAGYGTLYGDLGGFLAPLADLWKHEIYELAHYYNQKVFGCEVIPTESLSVVPSAELSNAQNVLEGRGDPLVYPYHDFLFRSWIEHQDRKTPLECLEAYAEGRLEELIGCEPGLVEKTFPGGIHEFTEDLEFWWNCYTGKGVFKRLQAPPVVALSPRAFGGDHRESLGSPDLSLDYLHLKESLYSNFNSYDQDAKGKD